MKNKFYCDNATLFETLRVARIDKQKSLEDWCSKELKKRGVIYVDKG